MTDQDVQEIGRQLLWDRRQLEKELALLVEKCRTYHTVLAEYAAAFDPDNVTQLGLSASDLSRIGRCPSEHEMMQVATAIDETQGKLAAVEDRIAACGV